MNRPEMYAKTLESVQNAHVRAMLLHGIAYVERMHADHPDHPRSEYWTDLETDLETILKAKAGSETR